MTEKKNDKKPREWRIQDANFSTNLCIAIQMKCKHVDIDEKIQRVIGK